MCVVCVFSESPEIISLFFEKDSSQIKFFECFSSIAPSVLVDEMVVASHLARSPYLKSEAFRMTSSLFQMTLKSSDIILFNTEVVAVKFCESVEKALKDGDLIKAKRIRDVLNAFDGFLTFCKSDMGVMSTTVFAPLKEVVGPLQNLKESSGSNVIKSICEKLTERIENEFKQEDIIINDGDMANDKKVQKKKKKKKKRNNHK